MAVNTDLDKKMKKINGDKKIKKDEKEKKDR